MDALLLNYEETPEKQLEDLIRQLVKQQLKEQLQELLKKIQPPIAQAEQRTGPETVKTDPGENKKPKNLCDQKLKKIIREMTPGLIRRELPLLIQARMLMKLYEYRDYGIVPSLLFSYAGTGKISGYRYICFFKERDYVTFIGARQNGKYILTDKGIGLIEGSK